jgi:hypothetical protein
MTNSTEIKEIMEAFIENHTYQNQVGHARWEETCIHCGESANRKTGKIEHYECPITRAKEIIKQFN